MRHGRRASITSARRPAFPTAVGRHWRACRSTRTETTFAADFEERTGFTFTVLDRADGDVIGCVYIYPAASPDADVTVQTWVRATHAELDIPLADAVAAWLADAWPWSRVDRPGR